MFTPSRILAIILVLAITGWYGIRGNDPFENAKHNVAWSLHSISLIDNVLNKYPRISWLLGLGYDPNGKKFFNNYLDLSTQRQMQKIQNKRQYKSIKVIFEDLEISPYEDLLEINSYEYKNDINFTTAKAIELLKTASPEFYNQKGENLFLTCSTKDQKYNFIFSKKNIAIMSEGQTYNPNIIEADYVLPAQILIGGFPFPNKKGMFFSNINKSSNIFTDWYFFHIMPNGTILFKYVKGKAGNGKFPKINLEEPRDLCLNYNW